jgi:hypothetical protein
MAVEFGRALADFNKLIKLMPLNAVSRGRTTRKVRADTSHQSAIDYSDGLSFYLSILSSLIAGKLWLPGR